ncbi:glycosyl transferase family 2 [Nocardioides silvaticus]|uniref:Glycosyl transferase family 2 n=1 Tax=Nocardioides silvaticus TaxID=2201891 RepID=A0A316TFG1_9ACTN|nr:glycosyltransferase [Nocardioides silvaticus]PWN02171.1 glycosyl transferase family 2 [Nocardioides silvaticus]
MTTSVLAVVLLLAAAGGQWLVRGLRRVPDAAQRSSGSASSVSVVVPARDEERTLPGLLGSLRDLTVPVAEVIVVDDGSRDRTAAVARAAGARVLPAAAPPPGWTGKAWACHRGAEEAVGDLLLFLDADTVLSTPDALAGLLDLRDRDGGLVSVQPYHRTQRPHEQLSAYFNVVAVMASGAFGRRVPSRPMAFGPCLLTTREDYRRAGGHAAVRGEILDDVALARAYARAGLPVRCTLGGRAISMRSYPDGIRQLAAGWTKNIASGASAASPVAALLTVGWVAAHHAVAVGAALSVVEVASGSDGPAAGHPLLWAAGWALLAVQLRAILGRIGGFRRWAWAVFPVPLLAFDAIFARSAVLTVVRRSVRWRGRDVDLRRAGRSGEVA